MTTIQCAFYPQSCPKWRTLIRQRSPHPRSLLVENMVLKGWVNTCRPRALGKTTHTCTHTQTIPHPPHTSYTHNTHTAHHTHTCTTEYTTHMYPTPQYTHQTTHTALPQMHTTHTTSHRQYTTPHTVQNIHHAHTTHTIIQHNT